MAKNPKNYTSQVKSNYRLLKTQPSHPYGISKELASMLDKALNLPARAREEAFVAAVFCSSDFNTECSSSVKKAA